MTSVLFLVLLSGIQQVSPQAPVITPMFTAEPARGPVFVIQCVNTTGLATSSGSDVWPLRMSAIRLDGRVLSDEGGRIGPGLTRSVQPGEKWSGIIELWQRRQDVSRAVAFGAMVRAPFLIPLDAGRHTMAVRCAGEWSEDVPFFVEK